MKRFFIGFSHQDSTLAQFVHAYLSDLFHTKASFFLSSQSIDPSEPWQDRLKSEIADAQGGMFLLTPISHDQPWIIFEFGALWAAGKPVFPLLIGNIDRRELHPPFKNFQATTLTNEPSAARFFGKIATMCGLSVPPVYDSKQFCREVRIRSACRSAFPSLRSACREIRHETLPTPASLDISHVFVEPTSLIAKVVHDNTLSVSGTVTDAGIVALSYPGSHENKFIVIEVKNSQLMRSFAREQMLKLVVGDQPLIPLTKAQCHPHDSQYIPRQNGFFIYPSPLGHYRIRCIIKIVFWKAELHQLQIKVYFVRFANSDLKRISVVA